MIDEQQQQAKYKIERGIQIPRKIQPTGREMRDYTHTAFQLSPGESFLLPSKQQRRAAIKLNGAKITVCRSHPDRKFVVRMVPEGARIWRTA